MIFVTVGTHEQQFDRLIKYIDQMKAEDLITEDVIMQTGYCTYVPEHCTFQQFFKYQDMIQMVNDARIVITHGGPSSFIMPLQVKKIPIVVPRMKKYDEHVNDHQVEFVKQVEARMKNIIAVTDLSKLADCILNYDEIINSVDGDLSGNNKNFCEKFEKLVWGLLED